MLVGGATVAPTNGGAGPLTVVVDSYSLTVTCLQVGCTVAPTSDGAGPLQLVSTSLPLHLEQRGATPERDGSEEVPSRSGILVLPHRSEVCRQWRSWWPHRDSWKVSLSEVTGALGSVCWWIPKPADDWWGGPRTGTPGEELPPAHLDSGWVAGVGQPGGLGTALGRELWGSSPWLNTGWHHGGKGPSLLGLGLGRPPLQQDSWTSRSAPQGSLRILRDLVETNAAHDLDSGGSRMSFPLHSTEEGRHKGQPRFKGWWIKFHPLSWRRSKVCAAILNLSHLPWP